MAAGVEDTVEGDRVHLPAFGDGGNVFVEAGDEGDVAGAGFGGDAGVADAEGAVGEDAGAEEWREGPRGERVWVGGVWVVWVGVWVRVRLEAFVGAETVAWGLC